MQRKPVRKARIRCIPLIIHIGLQFAKIQGCPFGHIQIHLYNLDLLQGRTIDDFDVLLGENNEVNRRSVQIW